MSTHPKENRLTIEMSIMSFETDYQGIVNNTEFIRFLERVRYALSKKLGFSFKQVRSSKLWTVMAHVEVNYVSPARFEDVMLGTGWVEKMGRSSLTIGYDFRLKGSKRLIADARQVVVFVDSATLKPTPIPPKIRHKINGFLSR
ncbi:MAG TPA: thioesterase family protein [bacterium]|nr:thioesterase family protein [bacterium]